MDTQLDAELRANILVEALPYIQEYYGQTVVVKYGGNAMINEELKDAVIHDLVLLNLGGGDPAEHGHRQGADHPRAVRHGL